MGSIYYNSKFRHADNKYTLQQNSYIINISNWRLMKNDIYRFGSRSVPGVLLITNEETIFIPNLVIEDVLAIARLPQGETINQFYTGWQYESAVPCYKCYGSGRVDWLQKIVKPTLRMRMTYWDKFIKSKSHIYMTKKYPNIIISITNLKDDSEELCKHCCGTGLDIDARRAPFKGFPGLKHTLYLKEYKV